MGTPVSKPDNVSPLVVNVSGTLLEGSADPNTTEVHANEQAGSHVNDGSFSATQNHFVKENERVQMLCVADDDNFEDKEWGDIYKRLKTNRNDDLHILNTRFKNNDLRVVPGDSVQSAGPIFTSAVAERPTRITSANFSPHAVAYEREKSRVKSAFHRNTGLMEDENSVKEDSEGYCKHNSAGQKVFAADKEIYLKNHSGCDPNRQNSHENSENSSPSDYSCYQGFDIVKNEKFKQQLDLADANELLYQGHACLDIPNDRRGLQSPTPKYHENDGDSCDDADIDPLEGLDIPRERVYSIGSASMYSVKEISDDLYQQYKAEIKNCIRSYGFFEAFPSPSIIGEAQKIYRQLDMPSPVDDDGNILPHPPKVTKNEYLVAESDSFHEVCEKIENMPESLSQGETLDIVHYLCGSLDDDKNKLIMLSAWIVVQQMRKAGPHSATSDTPDDWCRRFRTMCKFARIKTKLVNGIIRGPNYVPGSNLNLNRGHWLAVLVNYTWLLIDPYINLETSEDSKNTRSRTADMDKNLFHHVEKMFQDPEDFIFSHYPDEEHWQLLARPVTKAELHDLAVLKSGFFKFGMKVINSPKSVMIIKTTEAIISLAFHEEKMLQFKCKLRACDNSLSFARSRIYVFLETNLKDHLVNVRVRFPKKGSYILEILGSPDDQSWQSVISYKFEYEGDVFSNPFPPNPREEWGPGLETLNMGLTPVTYHSGEILMQKGVIQVAFRDKKRLQFDHVLFKEDINIKSNTMKVSFLKDENGDVIFVIDIDSKVTGTFTFQLLARADKRADFKNFCNYLIRKEKIVMIPRLEFKSTSTDDKEPTLAPKNGKLHFTVDTTGVIQLTVELKLHDRQELNFSEHTRHWIEDNTGYIDLNFPRKGKYSLNVLGRTINKGRFSTIKEETILVDIPSEKWSCFPKEGNNWNSWYKIDSPLSHYLEEKEDITFKVDVKNALDVAILAANGWFHLNRVGKSWQWEGQVRAGPKSTKSRLLARFEIGSDKWSDLLWFKIMSEEDFKGMEERQNSAREKAIAESKDAVK